MRNEQKSAEAIFSATGMGAWCEEKKGDKERGWTIPSKAHHHHLPHTSEEARRKTKGKREACADQKKRVLGGERNEEKKKVLSFHRSH